MQGLIIFMSYFISGFDLQSVGRFSVSGGRIIRRCPQQ